ncbi:MAG: protein phosphatase 2C domain-containing protein [Arenicellales bacterium]
MSGVPRVPGEIIAAAELYADTDFTAPRSARFLHGRLACFTHHAPDKEQNEDALAVIPTSDHSGLLVVADGLGGQPRGDLAARTVVETISEIVASGHESLREAILHGIDQANQRIIEDGYNGGATLAVLEIDARQVRPYHIGDAFVIVTGQRGRVKFQNIAHSPVGYAVESGLIDENDAVHHHERNLVSNFVGTTDMYINVGPQIELAPRDTVLIASDGLSDNLYVEEIIETMRMGALDTAAARLQSTTSARMSNKEAELPSHPDDLSFCLFRLDASHAARQLKMTF